MRPNRSILFVVSASLVALLLGGGLAVKVGASENSYKQVVTFSEILSLVMDNYVDPVDADRLLLGAYEGMLAGLDPNGAFLTPDEVAEWKNRSRDLSAGPGVSVLKSGRALQVVAVDEGSPAAEAGVEVGDQIRAVDGRGVRDLSLTQSWSLLHGKADSLITLDIIHPADGFTRESVEVARTAKRSPAYRLDVRRGVAVLRLFDMTRIDTDELGTELRDIDSRGIRTLLLDLRNLADLAPRDVTAAAGLFVNSGVLQLRDRAGRLVETLEVADSDPDSGAWFGEIAILVNGSTAGSAEALALLLQAERDGLVLGEKTYGLGAEVKLYELEDGSGLLVSSALWETREGNRWNGEGVTPDEIVHGEGSDYSAMSADQLDQALTRLEERARDESEEVEEAEDVEAT